MTYIIFHVLSLSQYGYINWNATNNSGNQIKDLHKGNINHGSYNNIHNIIKDKNDLLKWNKISYALNILINYPLRIDNITKIPHIKNLMHVKINDLMYILEKYNNYADLFQYIFNRKTARNNYLFDCISNAKIITNKFIISIKSWDHKHKTGGIIRLKTKNIIILSHKINVNKMGWFKSKSRSHKNDIKGRYNVDMASDNKKLTKLYHGKSTKHPHRGGGIIEIVCDSLINYSKITANGDAMCYGGSIFIVAKKMTNYGDIEAIGGGFDMDGKIAIYCDNFISNGNINPIPHVNTYNTGINITKKRLTQLQSYCSINNTGICDIFCETRGHIDLVSELMLNNCEYKLQLHNETNNDTINIFDKNNAKIYDHMTNIKFKLNTNNIKSSKYYTKYSLYYRDNINDINKEYILMVNGNISDEYKASDYWKVVMQVL